MKDVAFGQLYPVDSVVHRLDPRVKLLVTIAYIVLLFFANSFVTFGVIALSLLVVIFLSRVPLLKVLASLRFIIILLLFTMIVTVLLNDGAGRRRSSPRAGSTSSGACSPYARAGCTRAGCCSSDSCSSSSAPPC